MFCEPLIHRELNIAYRLYGFVSVLSKDLFFLFLHVEFLLPCSHAPVNERPVLIRLPLYFGGRPNGWCLDY